MSALLSLVLWSSSALGTGLAAWWALLAVLALRRPRPLAREAGRPWRFAVVVPAHNEDVRVGPAV